MDEIIMTEEALEELSNGRGEDDEDEIDVSSGEDVGWMYE